MTNLDIISPTPTQAVVLSMSDYIHPDIDVNKKMANDKNIMLWDGTRGSGKTDGALWEIKQEVDKGFGSEWKGIAFRINYNDLEDLIDKAENFFINQLGYDCKIKRGASPMLEFATGEKLLFRIMRNVDDYKKYHGHGYQYILFEEATLWHEIKDVMYEMMSCLRSPYNEKYKVQIAAKKKHKMILKVRLTTNPYGVGKVALKKIFVDNKKLGKPWIDGGITYMRFLSTFLDNPYIENSYISNFLRLTNKEKVKAWVYGSWDAKASGAFGDLWKPELFCLPNFKIPKNWRVNRSMDWGTREPFSVLWWAECDGTEVRYTIAGKERVFCPPEGTLILLDEWYGADIKQGQNVGLYMNASNVAKEILKRDKKLLYNILENGHTIEDGNADNSICSDVGNIHTIEKLFNKEGVYWTKSDKSKGSRERGVDIMIELMTNTVEQDTDRRHIYVFSNNCPNWIDNVMSLEYDPTKPNDVMTKGVPDHDWDATRYRIASKMATHSCSNSF